jgi:protein-S-isoprenylcysteine O-methyltransferase Ste14
MFSRQVRSILALPIAVTVGVPLVLALFYGLEDPIWVENGIPLWERIGFGLLFLAAGLWLTVSTIGLFSVVGEGTLAPWDPTRRLVVEGPYRYVRNPMISGVIFILIAEAILLGGWPLWVWMLLFAAVNMIYVPLSEEKGLDERFGKEYRAYRKNVPAWIPRTTPWEGKKKKNHRK